MNKPIRLDFFHDVICGWCYVLSPRIRQLNREFDLDIYHHAFALSATREEMVSKFGGSISHAKNIILTHWEQCALEDDLNRIQVEGMRKQSFEYPFSTPGLLACKAAEFQGGRQIYWDYFDAVTHAHMNHNRNIADVHVLTDIAKELGLDITKFLTDYQGSQVKQEISKDRKLANKYGIYSTPSLVINKRRILTGALKLNELRRAIRNESAKS